MSIASIMNLVSSLSQAEKLQLNVALSASMQKGSTPSSRKGKPASLGTRAWGAFVEHAKATWPERFASPSVPGDRLVIAGAIRLEDPAAYAAFCAKYKEEHSESHPEAAPESQAVSQAIESQVAESQATESQAIEAAPESQAVSQAVSQAEAKPEKPKRVISEEQKAKMKAGREAAKAKKDAAAAAAAAAATAVADA